MFPSCQLSAQSSCLQSTPNSGILGLRQKVRDALRERLGQGWAGKKREGSTGLLEVELLLDSDHICEVGGVSTYAYPPLSSLSCQSPFNSRQCHNTDICLSHGLDMVGAVISYMNQSEASFRWGSIATSEQVKQVWERSSELALRVFPL